MYKIIETEKEDLFKQIQWCEEKGHFQQVAYSTYNDSLTQVCFACDRVVTTYQE